MATHMTLGKVSELLFILAYFANFHFLSYFNIILLNLNNFFVFSLSIVITQRSNSNEH